MRMELEKKLNFDSDRHWSAAVQADPSLQTGNWLSGTNSGPSNQGSSFERKGPFYGPKQHISERQWRDGICLQSATVISKCSWFMLKHERLYPQQHFVRLKGKHYFKH